MNYREIDSLEAIKIKNKASTKMIYTVDFNLATVFTIDESSYLVTPLNPFGKNLIVYEKQLLDKFISEEYFPVDEKINIFYYKNKIIINNLLENKNELIKSLLDFENKELSKLTFKDIDEMYNTLKKQRKIEKYRLNFILLLGEFLIRNQKTDSTSWALLSNKQLLNPVINIVIFNNLSGEYFNIEELIFGKFGYLGSRYIFESMKNNRKKPNEIESIKKIF